MMLLLDLTEMQRQVGSSLRLFINLFCLPYFIFFVFNYINNKKLAIYTLCGIFFAIFLFYIFPIVYRIYIIDSLFSNFVRYSFFATSTAASYFSAIYFIFIIRSIPIYMSFNISFRFAFEVFILLIAVMMIIATGSKGPLLAFVVYFITILLLKKKYVLLAIFVLSLVALLNTELAKSYLQSIAENRGSDDISTGRLDIWYTSFYKIQTFGELITGVDTLYATHNTFLGILVRNGLLSLIIFLMLQLSLFSLSYQVTMHSKTNALSSFMQNIFAIQASIFAYGLYENFFYLNFGGIMMLYYSSFGIQLIYYGQKK